MRKRTLFEEERIEHEKEIKHFEKKYSFIFLKPSYDKIPYVSQFFNDEEIKKRILRFEHFLLGTYPIDMGTNIHKEMHNLRHTFTKEEYNWHKEHNKLGLNCWGSYAGVGLASLNKLLNRNDLHIIPFPETKDYSLKSFRQKLELCKDVDKKIYSILEKLYLDYKK